VRRSAKGPGSESDVAEVEAAPHGSNPWAEGARLAGRFAVLLGRGEFVGNLGDEPLVLRPTKQRIHPVGLPPTHHSLAGKPRIGGLQPTGLTPGAQHNARPCSGQGQALRPPRADLRDDARRLFGGRVDVGAPQLCPNRCGPLKMYSGK
jgi:hypothetical protein